MAGKSPVVADEDQRRALAGLARSRDRGEADRARAILLTLSGWTSPAIAAAFGVREDTVRLWRSAFMGGGVEALRTRVPPGPAPTKAERALEVAEELLAAPVADRPNWTLPRLAAELALPPARPLSRFGWAGQRMRRVIACADLGRGTGHGRQVARGCG